MQHLTSVIGVCSTLFSILLIIHPCPPLQMEGAVLPEGTDCLFKAA